MYGSLFGAKSPKSKTLDYLYFLYLTKWDALAGNRTRVYCLEGNNANHYTTNAYSRCDKEELVSDCAGSDKILKKGDNKNS